MTDKRVIDTIIAEALGEGSPGMTAVAYVIANRANNRGLTPLQVVKQPSQFSGYSNPGSAVKRAMNDPDTRARVEQIWNNVQSGAVPDPTNGGEYFHTTTISPGWSKGVNKHGTTTIGNHVFYKGKAPTITATAPEVPGRRPDSETAAQMLSRFAGNDAGVSALGFAPPMAPLPSPAPMRPPGIQINGGAGRDSLPGRTDRLAPPLPPQLNEQMVREYAANYVPTNQRLKTGLNTRSVQTIPVGPNDPLAGNVPDLQTELNRVAETRRQAYVPSQPPGSVRGAVRALPAVPGAMELAQAAFVPGNLPPRVIDGRGTDRLVADQRAEQLRTRPPLPAPRTGPIPMPTATAEWIANNAIPRGPGGRGRPTPPPPITGGMGTTRFAGTTDPLVPRIPDRLTPGQELTVAGVPGQTNPFGYPGSFTPPPAPGALRVGALTAPLGALTAPGTPGWRRGRADPLLPRRRPPGGPLDPAQTVQLADTGSLFDLVNSPGHKFIEDVNNGKRPILGGLLKMMLPKQGFGQVATARSTSPLLRDQRAWIAGGRQGASPLSQYAGANGYIVDGPMTLDDRHLEFVQPRH